MIHFTAQAQASEADWKFWFMAAIAVLSLVQTVVQPLVLNMVRGIKDRLNVGDRKFEAQGQSLVRMDERMESMQSDISEVREDVKGLTKTTQAGEVERVGTVGELRAEIERDFVRKSEFKDLVTRIDDQHSEVMSAINTLRRKA